MDRLAAPSDRRPPPVTSTAERCNARPVEPLEVGLDAETLPPPLTVRVVTLEVWVPKTQSWLVRPHVPTQQRVGGDQPPGSARSRERGRYRFEQARVGVGELGSVDLSAQHSELVAHHDDLEVLGAA